MRGGWRLTGSYSDPALPDKLMTFEEAEHERDRLAHDGIGVVFMPRCGVVGLDLDDCIDAMTNAYKLTPEQKAALTLFLKVAFVERSQSGTGLHAIALGNCETHKANGLVELFGDRNFLALTGSCGGGVASPIMDEAVEAVTKIISDIKEAQKASNTGEVIPLIAPGSTRAAVNDVNSEVLRRAPEAPDPERAASALAAINLPDDRDEWRNVAWAYRAAGGDYETMLSHCVPGSDAALKGIWDSYNPDLARGIGPGTLYKMALDAGWKPPRKVSDAANADAGNSDAHDDDRQKAQPTDLWLSKKFVLIIARERCFLYDHSAKQWRTWRKGSWMLCRRGEAIEAMKALAEILMVEALRQLRIDPQSERSKKLMACAQRAQSAQGIKAALELSQSAPELAVSAEDFDTDPDLFNAANGVIHLPSGELLEHDPAMMLFRQSPVEYDPDAVCPMFEAFMRQISRDDPDWIDYMQRCLGYALSGYVVEEKLFFWLGNGAKILLIYKLINIM